MRRELDERLGVVSAEAGRIGTEPELTGLGGQRVGIAPRRESDDVVVVGMTAQDVEGLATDRPGRSQDHHTGAHRCSA